MKVYKGYLIAIKRNISTIILYCTIFLGVAVSMVYLSGREEAGRPLIFWKMLKKGWMKSGLRSGAVPRCWMRYFPHAFPRLSGRILK